MATDTVTVEYGLIHLHAINDLQIAVFMSASDAHAIIKSKGGTIKKDKRPFIAKAGAAKVKKHNTLLYYFVILEEADIWTCVHEAVHMIDMLFADRGIDITERNTEIRGYFTEFLAKELWSSVQDLRTRAGRSLDREWDGCNPTDIRIDQVNTVPKVGTEQS